MSIYPFLVAHKCVSDSFIICCSGGADSTYLVHELAACTTQHHVVVYFNHHQRPKEIANEVAHVRALSNCYNYEFIRIDLPKKKSFSHAIYRNERLHALTTLCRSYPGYSVVTGHHLDDDIETFFYQLSKGATRHLHGIPPVTNHPTYTVYHPMLSISKSTILSYLSANGYAYCTDSSNQSNRYTRNNIRSVLPTVYRALGTNATQIAHSIRYLKQKRSERNCHIPHKRLNEHLLIKTSDIQSLDACAMFIEQQTGSYMNRTQERQLMNALNQTKLTRLILSTCVVDIDYKWVCISQSNWDEASHNSSFLYGQFSVQHTTPEQSTMDCLRVSKSDHQHLGYVSIHDCHFTIPNKKRRMRELTISPIQQKFWPVVYVNDRILWIPNVYISNSFGPYAIQFESHLCS